MIDEDMKNAILEAIARVLKDWTAEQTFAEPRKRWFKTGRATINKIDQPKTHFVVSIMVGKDEEETWQMIEDIIKIEDKYTADQKDTTTEEDFRKRVYRF